MHSAKIFCIYTTRFQNFFDRLHRVPGIEIRYLRCLTWNFRFQQFSTFFLDFWISTDEFFIFSHIGLGDCLKNPLSIIYQYAIIIWVIFDSIIEILKRGQIDPPSQMGEFRPPNRTGLTYSMGFVGITFLRFRKQSIRSLADGTILEFLKIFKYSSSEKTNQILDILKKYVWVSVYLQNLKNYQHLQLDIQNWNPIDDTSVCPPWSGALGVTPPWGFLPLGGTKLEKRVFWALFWIFW